MEAQAIYRKTEKGAEAIATRGHGVAGKLRMLLILVDGKKTGADLIQLAAGMGESVLLVEQLEKEGLIEPRSGAAPASTPSAPSLAPARSGDVPAGGGVGDLTQVKALAVRLLTDQLGPASEALAIKLEQAKNVPEFVEAMKRSYALVREARGAAAADSFGAQVEAKLTQG